MTNFFFVTIQGSTRPDFDGRDQDQKIELLESQCQDRDQD